MGWDPVERVHDVIAVAVQDERLGHTMNGLPVISQVLRRVGPASRQREGIMDAADLLLSFPLRTHRGRQHLGHRVQPFAAMEDCPGRLALADRHHDRNHAQRERDDRDRHADDAGQLVATVQITLRELQHQPDRERGQAHDADRNAKPAPEWHE
jgi:hypothetical protein